LRGGNSAPAQEVSKTPTKGSPYVGNQQREINKIRSSTYKPTPPPQPPKPLLNLQLYPQQPEKKEPKPLYTSPFPYHIPVGGPYYPTQELLQPLMYPVINTYTISTADPNMDFSKVNMVFEDILPIKEFVETSLTVEERLNMCNFVRAILVKQGDGESISLNGKDRGSLLSYIKFMELNPYHSHPYYNNPLRTLPNNFLIYRTAYPMRFAREMGTVVCSEPSIGINVRIYRLNMAEYTVKQRGGYDFHRYDIWREIAYYEHIREKILKRKLCPNFVMIYSYYINDNKTIDFNKINRIKGNALKRNDPRYVNAITMKQPLYVEKKKQIPAGHYVLKNDKGQQLTMISVAPPKQENVQLSPNPPNSIIPSADVKAENKQEEVKLEIKDSLGNPVEIVDMEINPLVDSGKCVVALTEAPTHTLLAWATKTYQKDINIRRMINTGFHGTKVWNSIIFQLMVALYALQKELIAIRDMRMSDSIFIKDLKIEANSSGWWKYRIDGIDYYIPNYGYLLQIDSSYKDIPTLMQTLSTKDDIKRWKIYSNIYTYDGGEIYLDDDLRRLIHGNFCNLINSNSFNKEFMNRGGVPPNEDVKLLLDKINKDASQSSPNVPFGDYIYKFMGQFLHNRVGTLLLQKEIGNIQFSGLKEFKKGDMVIYESNHDTYTWVIFIKNMEIDDEDLGKRNVAIVLTKETPESKDVIERRDIPKDALYPYIKNEKIDFIIRPQEPKFSDDELLETYNI
jgi:hypothetical protein